MIKLSKILSEINNNDVSEFNKLISTGEYILPDSPIFRGVSEFSNKHTDTFDIFDIRKDRRGKDSSNFSNLIFNIYCEHFNIPKRSEILFCTTTHGKAEDYYDDVYMVLPHKNCELYYFPGDSYEVLEYLDRVIVRNSDEGKKILKENGLDVIYNFTEMLSDTNYMENHETYAKKSADYLIKNINDFFNSMEKLEEVKESTSDTYANSYLFSILTFLRKLKVYKTNIQKISKGDSIKTFVKGVKANDEIWITGDKYCLVNIDFYMEEIDD